MEYKGKLYGKIRNKYFDTGHTAEDYDKLEQSQSVKHDSILIENDDKISAAEYEEAQQIVWDYEDQLEKSKT